MVGASGAIAGVLGAYLITYPRANVHCFVWIVIFFWIVTVPAWILLGLWFVGQLFSGLESGVRSPGVAFWAHVGGFVAGIAHHRQSPSPRPAKPNPRSMRQESRRLWGRPRALSTSADPNRGERIPANSTARAAVANRARNPARCRHGRCGAR